MVHTIHSIIIVIKFGKLQIAVSSHCIVPSYCDSSVSSFTCNNSCVYVER